jgi:hypothetical protein
MKGKIEKLKHTRSRRETKEFFYDFFKDNSLLSFSDIEYGERKDYSFRLTVWWYIKEKPNFTKIQSEVLDSLEVYRKEYEFEQFFQSSYIDGYQNRAEVETVLFRKGYLDELREIELEFMDVLTDISNGHINDDIEGIDENPTYDYYGISNNEFYLPYIKICFENKYKLEKLQEFYNLFIIHLTNRMDGKFEIIKSDIKWGDVIYVYLKLKSTYWSL